MGSTTRIHKETQREVVSEFHLGYVPALDGLRGVSILAVMAFNGHMFLMHGGFIGVDIFFVLSGFLITSLLVQDYNPGLKKFYLRRALRLLPALFVLMLASVAYALFLQSPEKAEGTLKGVLYTLVYLANWAQTPPRAPGIGPLSHAWSLSVEEQFYILWPLLLLFMLKMRNRGYIVLIISFFVGVSIFLNVWFWQSGVPYLRMYFGSDTRANEILIGCVAALLLSWGIVRVPHEPWLADRLKITFHLISVLSFGLIVLSFFLVRHYGPFVYNGGFALISIGIAILIIDLVLFSSPISRSFEFGPLVWIGKISYGLYLWHFPVFEGLRRLFEGWINPVFYQAGGLIITFAVASVSYYFLEQPLLRLRHQFDPTGSTTGLISVSTKTAQST